MSSATCPVCRNRVAIADTTRRQLDAHDDLFGNPCPNTTYLDDGPARSCTRDGCDQPVVGAQLACWACLAAMDPADAGALVAATEPPLTDDEVEAAARVLASTDSPPAEDNAESSTPSAQIHRGRGLHTVTA